MYPKMSDKPAGEQKRQEAPAEAPEKPAPARWNQKRSIGFLAQWDDSSRGGASGTHLRENELLYRFDEGQTISFLEGTHNVLVLGGTGRGKTSSLILPMLDRLLGAGFGGLVIDVKGNFTDQTRSLARLHGREQDILELGTADTAFPINLLAGLTHARVAQMIKTLTMSGVQHSNNSDWHEKGVSIANDVVQLLLYLAEKDPCFTPKLTLVQAVCNDYELARSLFAYFKEHVLDEKRPEQVLFASRLNNEAFHVLNPQMKDTIRDANEWLRQLSWNLQRVRQVLATFSDDPALIRNFSAPSTECFLDFRRLIYEEKKVVILRFTAGTSEAGKLIARFIKEKYFLDVYTYGLQMLEPGCHTFLVADEFQDVMDVNSSNDMNDFSWFSKSREFRNINLVATQSMASLYSVSRNTASVYSLLSNCSTKIVLQLDDPNTFNYLRGFPNLQSCPHELGCGRVLLFKYDLSDRHYLIAEQGVQESHDRNQLRLQEDAAGPGPDRAAEPVVVAAKTQKARHPSGLSAKVLQKVLACDPLPDTAGSKALKMKDTAKRLEKRSPELLVFFDRYREFFDGLTADQLAIPSGWMGLAEEGMSRVAALGMPFTVTGFHVRYRGLEILLSNPHSPAQFIVADIATRSLGVCMQCGRKLRKKKPSAKSHEEGPRTPLCRACRSLGSCVGQRQEDPALPKTMKAGH